MGPQNPQITKAVLKRKNKIKGIIHQDFRQCYKSTIIKTAWCWYKNRHIHQWNTMGSQEMKPHLYGQLIYGKGGKNIQ